MAIESVEKTLRIFEEDNHQLKFDLMAVLETAVSMPGPDVLVRHRDALVEMVRVQSSESATVIAMTEAGKDGYDFGIEMRSILEAAGWNVKFMTSTFENGMFYGLQVVRDSSDAGDAAARVITGAFEKAGIPFVLRTAPTPKNLSPLRLIIGQNNW